jgi:hypothetical protein
MQNEVIFVLDRSGSMGGSEEATIRGYNEFLDRQKDSALPAAITTALFDDRYELLLRCVDIREALHITRREYFVRGGTALLDAVGRSIRDTRERISEMESGKPEHVIFVIITDGLENASREYTHTEVRELIAEQKERAGWEFIFLGADLSDMRDAEGLGIGRDKRASYSKQDSREMFAEMSCQVEGFKQTGKLKQNWSAGLSGGTPAAGGLPYIRVPGGIAVIDTGSPLSFGNIPSVTIDGKAHALARNSLLGDIRKNLGGEVTALLGMDIIGGYDMIIRKDHREAELYAGRQSAPGAKVPITAMLGVPMLTVSLLGQDIACVLDTGAHIQYIDAGLAAGLRQIGEATDFYPGMASFKTPLYQLEIKIAGESVTTRFGVMPPQLNMMMGMLGAGGILGIGCFMDYNLLFSARDGYFTIWA